MGIRPGQGGGWGPENVMLRQVGRGSGNVAVAMLVAGQGQLVTGQGQLVAGQGQGPPPPSSYPRESLCR